MAALPQSLPMQAPRGTVGGVQPLDFSSVDNALQEASRQIQRVDEARREADDRVAQQEMEAHQQEYQLGATERANLYDGRDPGFAANELTQFDATFKPLLDREDLSDGVRMAIGKRLRAHRAAMGTRAVTVEGEVRGRRSAADRDAAEQASAVRILMGVNSSFDDAEDEIRNNWDGISEGYASNVLTKWRVLSEGALEGIAPGIRDRLAPMLLSQETNLQARVLAAEDERRDAATLVVVKDGLTQFVNRATRDPSLIGRAETELAPILEAAPAFMRAALLKETVGEARYTSTDARITSGQYEEVSKEIEAGNFDDMDPARLQRLKDGVVSARANGVVVSEQEKADLEAAVAADLRNILKGSAPDATLLERARRAGGEPLETRIRIDQQAAQNVRPLMARLRSMTPIEAQAELKNLEETSNDAIGLRTLQLASEMVSQDSANRADPANWAVTSVGPGDQVAEGVRGKWEEFQRNPLPASAQAYATSTWIAQQHAGIAESNRRILPRATAEAWVESLDVEADPQRSLQQLTAQLSLFGRYRPQIVRELRMAGLTDSDLGATVYYGSSNRHMGLYARDRSVPLNELVAKQEDRNKIDGEIQTALAPYLRAFNTRDNGATSFAAARRAAYSMVKRGVSVDDAVQAATGPILNSWDFQGTWALPANRGYVPERITRSMSSEVRTLIRRGGEEGYAPPSDRYTPEQSRRIYADLIEEKAYWRNLADGTGAELVLNGEDGRPQRVKDKAGNDVVRTWEELQSASRDAPASWDGGARRSPILG